jgi:hypothetical protein
MGFMNVHGFDIKVQGSRFGATVNRDRPDV